MYIIIPLVLLSFAATATESTSYLLATVLFYADNNGSKTVAWGVVPKKVETLIRREIKMQVKNAKVKVVPIFKNAADTPPPEHLMGYVKNTFKSMFVAPIPKRLARKIVFYRMMAQSKNPAAHKIMLSDLILGNSSRMTPNQMLKSLTDINNVQIHTPETIEKMEKQFLPNAVYFAVENSCALWKKKCDLTNSEHFDISNLSFKHAFFKLSKLPA